MTVRPRIELLAPAGDERALRAALAAGADAVYFGLERWSARAFAGNFAGDEAARAVDLAHRFDVGAHLALNTLLKDDEIEPALKALQAPYLAGLDALIVADLAFATLVCERYPGLPLHASTQLDTHSSAQLGALDRLGFARAILARELSLVEIGALDAHGLELEAFVHGALCYGYSGDCLLSSMVGGRSGNRGRCSQSCRLRYRLTPADAASGGSHRSAGTCIDSRDGAPALEGGLSRVLSTADLCAIGALPALIDAGVTSFKIEGRMKDPAYVAVTTAVYREALDAALADPAGFAVRPEWMARLEQSFTRGFTAAHLDGRHHEVRSGGRGGHRGVLVGRVERVDDEHGTAVVRLAKPVAAGDVVYLYTSWGQSDPTRLEDGATDRLTLRLRERASVKDRLFRLAAAGIDEFTRDAVAGRYVARPLGLAMRLGGSDGTPATLTARLVASSPEPRADAVTVGSDAPLSAARTAALTEAKAHDALGALGGTPYALLELEYEVDDGLFLPVAELKGLRRRAVAALDERRLAARRRRPSPAPRPGLQSTRPSTPAPGTSGASDERDALQPAAGGGPPSVILVVEPGEEPLAAPGVEALCVDVATSDPPEAVTAARERGAASGLPVRCRPPEVLFDGDAAWWEAIVSQPWDGVVARHLGLLLALGPRMPFVLEYPLQGLNGRAAGVLAGLAGHPPAAVVASPEASLVEIAALAAALTRFDPMPALEVLAFGRQQVLRTRDQLGRSEGLVEAAGPAEHTEFLLEDAKGYVVPARVDAGGARLFNARVTNVAAHADELRATGVARFIVVQRDLSPDEGRAFASGGLPALASFSTRERSTTGHLFRGVA